MWFICPETKAAYKNRPVLSLAFTLCNLFSFFQRIEFVEGKWTVLHSEFLWSSKVTRLILVPDIFNMVILSLLFLMLFFTCYQCTHSVLINKKVPEQTMNNRWPKNLWPMIILNGFPVLITKSVNLWITIVWFSKSVDKHVVRNNIYLE